MKKTTILAFASILVLALAFASPAFAHTVSITIDRTSMVSGDRYTVSGTVSPTPAPSGTSALVQVFNPSNVLVDAAAASVTPATGAFSVTLTAGGSALWSTGTYTVRATYAHDLTETPSTDAKSFSFTGAAAAVGAALFMSIDATSPLLPGQAGRVYVLLSWANGSLASVTNFPIQHYHPPAGALVNFGDFQTVHPGLYFFEFPAQTAAGAYAAHVQANVSNVKVQGLTVITVSDQLASASAVAGLSTDLGTLKSSVTADLTTLKSDVAGAKVSADAAKSSVDTLKTDLANLGSSIGNVSTFVLVVAALAAITLVLEIAILIRRART